jgi:gamma-glutamyltranspeptidase/glutathione hydrolase
MRGKLVAAAIALFTVGSPLLGEPAPPRADAKTVRGGLIVCVDPLAATIGATVLMEGGNAVDAAVAASFALAVTFPEAGNIGGGGFLVARLANTGECFAVDYRETAPKLAHQRMFLDAQGRIDPEKSRLGWLVVGVPGTTMGLWTAHQKAGRLPWRRLVAPAVKLAEDGFVVDDVLAKGLAAQERDFRRFDEPARVYFPDGKPPRAGARLRLPELADTLRRIMTAGPSGFYGGRIAEAVDRAMRENGGILRAEDLADYRAVIRGPVRGSYRGHEIVSIGPPSSGGIALIEMLNILEGYPLAHFGPQAPTSLHLMVEAMKRAYCDRARYLGDADHVSVPVRRLLSKEHAAECRSTIGDGATAADRIGADLLTAESDSTTHLSIVDADGNVVANTTTLEGSYGSKVIAPGTGFLLNNEMRDFNLKPGLTDRTGRIGTPPNLIAPGKRMLSSQTPTLVLKDGKPLLVLGSPGGRSIIATVLQVIVNVIDYQMPIQQAVDAGRVYHTWLPDVVRIEKRLPQAAIEALRQRGHTVQPIDAEGDCHAIWIDPSTGLRHPGIDKRRRGAAAGQ